MRIIIVLLSTALLFFAGCDDGGGNGSSGYQATVVNSHFGLDETLTKGFTGAGEIPLLIKGSGVSRLYAFKESVNFDDFATAAATMTFGTSFDNFIYLTINGDEAGENIAIDQANSVIKIDGTEYDVTGGAVTITSFGSNGDAAVGSYSNISITVDNYIVTGSFKAMVVIPE